VTKREVLTAIAAAVALAVLAAACSDSSSDSASPSESARVGDAMSYIRGHNQDVAFEGLRETDRAPGGKQDGPAGRYPPLPSLLVGVRDGEGYRGYVSPDPGADPASSPASVASSTKSFTAALILQLDQEGKLSIDDTLANPRWRDAIKWPNGESITLRMVLAHTAGIPNYEDSEAFARRNLDPGWDPTPREVISFARRLPPSFAPGRGWEYSNTGYQILGLVIEAVTGRSYADELERRFFGPLDLENTHLFGHQPGPGSGASYFLWCKAMPPPKPSSPPAAKQKSEAACLGKRPPAYLPMSEYYANNERKLAWADGGLVSTTQDMTSWITKLVASDEVLDRKHRALMQRATPQSVKALADTPDRPVRRHWKGYGLGLQVFRYDAGPGFGHGGNIEGFSSNAVYLPGHGNDFALEVIPPLIEADTAFDSTNRIATAVTGRR